MKIVGGHNDYLFKKELKTLVLKMSNLSSYKPVISNVLILTKEEQKLLHKRQEDYYLFEAAFIYLFSQSEYVDHIRSVFNNLTYKQKTNFYGLYKSCTETAIKHGFLTDYSLILTSMEKWSIHWWIKGIGSLLLFVSTFFITKSLLITLYYFISLFYLRTIYSKMHDIDLSKKQLDLIVQKLNTDIINSHVAWAHEKLVDSGWINKNGKIIISAH